MLCCALMCCDPAESRVPCFPLHISAVCADMSAADVDQSMLVHHTNVRTGRLPLLLTVCVLHPCFLQASPVGDCADNPQHGGGRPAV